MKTSHKLSILSLGVVAVLTLSTLVNTGGRSKDRRMFYGPAEQVGNGTARTFVATDEDGTPVSIGLALSEAALGGLPAEPVVFNLDLPDRVDVTPFDHAMLDWNPQGHEPEGVYTHPHFDFHFYLTSPQEQARIAGGPDTTEVPAPYIPQDYFSTMESVPNMGTHWLDTHTHELHGQRFDRTLLYGFYQGKMVFVEPMITRAFLESKPAVSEPIKQPAAFQRSGRYPMRYSIRHDAQRKRYLVSLDELTHRLAEGRADGRSR